MRDFTGTLRTITATALLALIVVSAFIGAGAALSVLRDITAH
jgi:hypothetical protein